MTAAVLYGKEDLRIEQVPVPSAGPGEIVVSVAAALTCGTDLKVYRRGYHAKMLKPPIPFGHELAGTVVEVGKGVRKFRVADRVVALNSAPCDACYYCRHNQQNLCDDLLFNNGAYAEYIRIPARIVEKDTLHVPDGVPFEHAALTEPLAVGVHAVEKAALKGDEAPLVVGCGPVGLAVIAALRLKGIRPIVAADFSPKRRELAVKMGADVVVNPAQGSPYAKLEPGKRAAIFECVGVPGVLQQMFEQVPRDARVVVVGVCMEPDTIEPMFGIVKELSLQFVLGYTPEEFARSLHLLADGKVDAPSLITGKIGLADVKGAFEELGNPERHTKILVEPWR